MFSEFCFSFCHEKEEGNMPHCYKSFPGRSKNDENQLTCLPPSLFLENWSGRKVHLLCMLLKGQVETEMKSCIFYFGFCMQTPVHLGNALTMNILSLGWIFRHWLTACVRCPLASKKTHKWDSHTSIQSFHNLSWQVVSAWRLTMQQDFFTVYKRWEVTWVIT